jgi:FKBP-type peptidyl-prolyl cis-trans isomerase 2
MMKYRVERSGKCALIRYRGGAVSERLAEDHSTGEPERIRIGIGAVPLGIDEALYDMAIGEQRTVLIPPAKAYGDYDPEGVQVYPCSFIPDGDSLEEGQIIGWKNPSNGVYLPVKVIRVEAGYVQLDFNHPLAGKTLEYWIELIDVVD